MPLQKPASGAVSETTTGRLSLYLRCLNTLAGTGVATISSQDFATRFHLNSAQIRKDLANFGDFGIRGVGYDVAALQRAIVDILGLDRVHRVVILGAGNLGMALAEYPGFNTGEFRIVALFDISPQRVGHPTRTGIPILHVSDLPDIVAASPADIGIIAVPAATAQQAFECLADSGIRAILNFAPVALRGRAGVKMRSVDLRINLEALCFFLKSSPGDSGEPE